MFNHATEIAADVVPNPIDYRRDRGWRRSFDRRLNGHISGKSRCPDQCDSGDSGCQSLHGSPRNTQNLPYGLPGGCDRFSTVKGKTLAL